MVGCPLRLGRAFPRYRQFGQSPAIAADPRPGPTGPDRARPGQTGPDRARLPGVHRDRGGLQTAGYAQFAQDVGDVNAGSLPADEQRLPDLTVGVAVDHKTEHFVFAVGQPEVVVSGVVGPDRWPVPTATTVSRVRWARRASASMAVTRGVAPILAAERRPSAISDRAPRDRRARRRPTPQGPPRRGRSAAGCDRGLRCAIPADQPEAGHSRGEHRADACSHVAQARGYRPGARPGELTLAIDHSPAIRSVSVIPGPCPSRMYHSVPNE
jgi:hypothetical protein